MPYACGGVIVHQIEKATVSGLDGYEMSLVQYLCGRGLHSYCSQTTYCRCSVTNVVGQTALGTVGGFGSGMLGGMARNPVFGCVV